VSGLEGGESSVCIVVLSFNESIAFSAGDDYGANLNPITFLFLPGGVTRLCTMATIVDDNRFEVTPESFQARLSLIPTERVTVSPERTTIQILDEDSKSIIMVKETKDVSLQGTLTI
jgi:hypothetical protein